MSSCRYFLAPLPVLAALGCCIHVMCLLCLSQPLDIVAVALVGAAGPPDLLPVPSDLLCCLCGFEQFIVWH
jgi:hypothetical protein